MNLLAVDVSSSTCVIRHEAEAWVLLAAFNSSRYMACGIRQTIQISASAHCLAKSEIKIADVMCYMRVDA